MTEQPSVTSDAESTTRAAVPEQPD
uniref:WAS/WASL interacting protein family, member 3 n=1 Tax=Nothobranchius rachovii TaxID=451742 RepID=A0A1A8SGI4_9TELE